MGWQPDAHRGSRHARGYGWAWERLRAEILKRDNYLCQCKHCTAEGRIALATEVDHIVSKAKAKRMRWTQAQIDHPSNLQAINSQCHKRKTSEDEGRTPIQRPTIGLDGFPVQR